MNEKQTILDKTIKLNNDIEKERKEYKKWMIINVSTFIISILALIVSTYTIKYLLGMDEYELGLSMIFLFPIILIIIGIYAVQIGILTFITTIISMLKIAKKNEKILVVVEILLYFFWIIRVLL